MDCRPILAAMLLTALAACADAPGDAATPTSCPVLASDDWQAELLLEGNDPAALRLVVTGTVTLPTPGHAIDWTMGPLDRRQPPALRLALTATPHDGLVAQVLTNETVRFEGASPVPAYRAVIVTCGESVLAEIPDVALGQ
ncbi:MAG: hypothetical protein AAF899_17665 [Pseudomonadota bacterium]